MEEVLEALRRLRIQDLRTSGETPDRMSMSKTWLLVSLIGVKARSEAAQGGCQVEAKENIRWHR